MHFYDCRQMKILNYWWLTNIPIHGLKSRKSAWGKGALLWRNFNEFSSSLKLPHFQGQLLAQRDVFVGFYACSTCGQILVDVFVHLFCFSHVIVNMMDEELRPFETSPLSDNDLITKFTFDNYSPRETTYFSNRLVNVCFFLVRT